MRLKPTPRHLTAFCLTLTAATATLATAVLLAAFVLGEDLPERGASMLDVIQEVPVLLAGICTGALLLVYVLWKIRAHRWLRATAVRPVWVASLLVFGVAQLGVAMDSALNGYLNSSMNGLAIIQPQ